MKNSIKHEIYECVNIIKGKAKYRCLKSSPCIKAFKEYFKEINYDAKVA